MMRFLIKEILSRGRIYAHACVPRMIEIRGFCVYLELMLKVCLCLCHSSIVKVQLSSVFLTGFLLNLFSFSLSSGRGTNSKIRAAF